MTSYGAYEREYLFQVPVPFMVIVYAHHFWIVLSVGLHYSPLFLSSKVAVENIS